MRYSVGFDCNINQYFVRDHTTGKMAVGTSWMNKFQTVVYKVNDLNGV